MHREKPEERTGGDAVKKSNRNKEESLENKTKDKAERIKNEGRKAEMRRR